MIAPRFQDGLSQPSGLSLATAIFVFGSIWLFVVFGVTEDYMRSEKHQNWFHSEHDFNTQVSSAALQLADDPSGRKIVLLGASSFRVAIRPEILSSHLSQEATVYKLCTPGQNFWESAVLLDQIPDGSEGLVVIGVGPGRYSRDAELLVTRTYSPTLALKSPTLDEELALIGESAPASYSNYFLNNRHYFLPRIKYFVKNSLMGPPEQTYRHLGISRRSNKRLVKLSERMSAAYHDSVQNWDLNRAVLERAVNRLRSRTKMEVVLLEGLLSEDFVSNYLGHDYRIKLKQFNVEIAAKLEIEHWDVAEHVSFSNEEFNDYTHLGKFEAADRFTIELAALINQLES